MTLVVSVAVVVKDGSGEEARAGASTDGAQAVDLLSASSDGEDELLKAALGLGLRI